MPSIVGDNSHADSCFNFFIEFQGNCVKHLDFWHTSVPIGEVLMFLLKRCKTPGVLTFNWSLFFWKNRNEFVLCHNPISPKKQLLYRNYTIGLIPHWLLAKMIRLLIMYGILNVLVVITLEIRINTICDKCIFHFIKKIYVVNLSFTFIHP